jgi:hypothetical protein
LLVLVLLVFRQRRLREVSLGDGNRTVNELEVLASSQSHRPARPKSFRFKTSLGTRLAK